MKENPKKHFRQINNKVTQFSKFIKNYQRMRESGAVNFKFKL